VIIMAYLLSSPAYPSRLCSDARNGFTLIETLVSLVVISIAAVGAIAAFNLITQSVGGTGLQADRSRRIDADIAAISRLSEFYTSCSTPAGAVPANISSPDAACGAGSAAAGVQIGNSFYYFPDPTNTANVNAFFTACRSTTEASHITANFRTAINGLGQPGGGVTRQAATRIAGGDPSNHIVQVEWRDPQNRVLRSLRITPLVSAWCP
jgi:prepilin-type N-terminal cleavage/methylation domain-containing protein